MYPCHQKSTTQPSAIAHEGQKGKEAKPRKHNCDKLTNMKARKQRAAGRPTPKVLPAEGRKAALQVTKSNRIYPVRGRGKATTV